MRNTWKVLASLLVVGASLLFVGPAFAHHGAAAYDVSKTITLNGTVSEFQFINPHVLISIEVKDPATGKMQKWQGELTSPNHLIRAGWTRGTLKTGDQVTLVGSPAKSGSTTMWLRKVMKDGQEISLAEN
jgi:Family of unknown function (DUF6152)